MKQMRRSPTPVPQSSSSSSSSESSDSEVEEIEQMEKQPEPSMPLLDTEGNEVANEVGYSQSGNSILEEAVNSIDLPTMECDSANVSRPSNCIDSVQSCSSSNTKVKNTSKKSDSNPPSSSKDKPLKVKGLRSFPSPPTFNQLNRNLLHNLIKFPNPMDDYTCQHLTNFIEIQMSQLTNYIKGEQDRIMIEFSSQVNLLSSVIIHNYTGGKQLKMKKVTDTTLLKKLFDFSKILKDK